MFADFSMSARRSALLYTWRIRAREESRQRFFLILGPGLITGAPDDDPSGIGTCTTAGASLGFALAP